MPSIFACMSYLLLKLFFNSKITLTFISVVTHAQIVKKKVIIRLKNSTCEVSNGVLTNLLKGVCPFVSFSNGRGN